MKILSTQTDSYDSIVGVGAIITNDHFVYASGKHGSMYVDKDMVYPDTEVISELCEKIATRFVRDRIQGVVAPEKGGIILSQWVAHHLTKMTHQKVLAFYAEKTKDKMFILKRGKAAERINGQRVLLAEDVLNTGGSVKKVVGTVRTAGGIVMGLGALWNRGGVTVKDVGNLPELFSLVDAKLDAWDLDEGPCPLCEQDIPINTVLGKGAEFLAQQKTR